METIKDKMELYDTLVELSYEVLGDYNICEHELTRDYFEPRYIFKFEINNDYYGYIYLADDSAYNKEVFKDLFIRLKDKI